MHPVLSTHPNSYNGEGRRLLRPKIIGFMSIDGEKRIHSDTSQLKFARRLSEEPVRFDLNLNCEKSKIRKTDLNEKISHLLEYIKDHETWLQSPAIDLDYAKVFCYRRTLTSIANTPYENLKPWRIVATLYKSNIYLCSIDIHEGETSMSTSHSIGHKFEQYMVSAFPDVETANPEDGVDENEQFSLFFETRLDKHSLVYSAEMDGIRCDKSPVSRPPTDFQDILKYLNNQQFIEMKTNLHFESPKQYWSFRKFKTIKWFLQSYVAGVDTILCGFRNREGIVENIKLFTLTELAAMSEKYWTPNVCVNFLNSCLTYFKECLKREVRRKHGEMALKKTKTLPLLALQFEWNPRGPVKVTHNYDYDKDPILPKWFVSH